MPGEGLKVSCCQIEDILRTDCEVNRNSKLINMFTKRTKNAHGSCLSNPNGI